MKYSVGGSIFITDDIEIVDVINNYKLWKLITNHEKDNSINENVFIFEVWVNTESDKSSLFGELKPFVDTNGGFINWHECTHDEEISRLCAIAEEYGGE